MTNNEPISGRRLWLLKRHVVLSYREENASNITQPANESMVLKDNAVQCRPYNLSTQGCRVTSVLIALHCRAQLNEKEWGAEWPEEKRPQSKDSQAQCEEHWDYISLSMCLVYSGDCDTIVIQWHEVSMCVDPWLHWFIPLQGAYWNKGSETQCATYRGQFWGIIGELSTQS